MWRLARALVHDPDVLLLDEAGHRLDQEHLDLLASLVQGRAIPARTVILTTHNLDRALALCNRVTVLAQGGWSIMPKARPSITLRCTTHTTASQEQRNDATGAASPHGGAGKTSWSSPVPATCSP